ncbi:hypothetical protein BDP27DRAFT_1366781 [Rhodocollybia butyracea]|uniref:GLPGLI family protein n=1 Tax=Rhodocollybia butyracea TaxID=206335 RepID=A0A9P5PG00_9AGAR|nr:hypothetical protein BDP27DRAFT_1366781 [Rhodocollybia butyracea]
MSIFLLVMFISTVPSAVSGSPVKKKVKNEIAFKGALIDHTVNPIPEGRYPSSHTTKECKRQIAVAVTKLAAQLELITGKTAIDWTKDNFVDYDTSLVYFKFELVGQPSSNVKPYFGWAKPSSMRGPFVMGIYLSDTTSSGYRVIPYDKGLVAPDTWNEEETKFLTELNPVAKWASMGKPSAPPG